MNINNELVQQVKEGTPIAHTKKPEDFDKLLSVALSTGYVFYDTIGNLPLYWIEEGEWIGGDYNPTGLTPIPLDLFFVVEEEKDWVKVSDRLPEKEGIYTVKRAMSDMEEKAEFTGKEFTNYHGYRVVLWKQSSPPPTAERESETLAKIEKQMSLFPDNPTTYERGLYDGYLNCYNWLKQEYAAKSTPPEKEESELLKRFGVSVEHTSDGTLVIKKRVKEGTANLIIDKDEIAFTVVNDSLKQKVQIFDCTPEKEVSGEGDKDPLVLVVALESIIEMNRQTAIDQYGNADKAETWSCVTVARTALKLYEKEGV